METDVSREIIFLSQYTTNLIDAELAFLFIATGQEHLLCRTGGGLVNDLRESVNRLFCHVTSGCPLAAHNGNHIGRTNLYQMRTYQLSGVLGLELSVSLHHPYMRIFDQGTDTREDRLDIVIGQLYIQQPTSSSHTEGTYLLHSFRIKSISSCVFGGLMVISPGWSVVPTIVLVDVLQDKSTYSPNQGSIKHTRPSELWLMRPRPFGVYLESITM